MVREIMIAQYPAKAKMTGVRELDRVKWEAIALS